MYQAVVAAKTAFILRAAWPVEGAHTEPRIRG
jgi:hypothetical protein